MAPGSLVISSRNSSAAFLSCATVIMTTIPFEMRYALACRHDVGITERARFTDEIIVTIARAERAIFASISTIPRAVRAAQSLPDMVTDPTPIGH